MEENPGEEGEFKISSLSRDVREIKEELCKLQYCENVHGGFNYLKEDILERELEKAEEALKMEKNNKMWIRHNCMH